MSDEKSVITIDGPSGVGKGTVAKIVAEKLKFSYLDTGAMYRAFALKVLKSKTNPENNNELESLLESTKIDFLDNKIFLDSKDISDQIRTEEISLLASKIATKKIVRKFLVKLQRLIGSRGNIVAEGRDMGTYVFPDAKNKFYLDAKVEERAKRRYIQLGEKNIDFNKVKIDLEKRDIQDKNREESPLHPASNAVIIDTTNLSISEVVGKILLYVGGSV